MSERELRMTELLRLVKRHALEVELVWLARDRVGQVNSRKGLDGARENYEEHLAACLHECKCAGRALKTETAMHELAAHLEEDTVKGDTELYREALVLHLMATIQSEGVVFIGDVAGFDDRPEIQAILEEALVEADRKWVEHLRRSRAKAAEEDTCSGD